MALFASAVALGCLSLVVKASQCNGLDYYQLTTERLANFEAKDYIFDLQQAANDSDTGVGSFNAGVSDALFGTFIAGVVINFEKCAINLPHIHPRATEMAMVLEGELEMGFIAENGLPPNEYKLREGQVMVFPQASLHYQYNDSCRGAKMYAVLNHHDPGTLSLPARLNEFTNADALAAAYGVYPFEVKDIVNDAPTSSPAQGEKCLTRCNGE